MGNVEQKLLVMYRCIVRRVAMLVTALCLPLLMFGQTAEELYNQGENFYYGENGSKQSYADAVKC